MSILLTYIFGSALGWVLVKVTRAPQHLHGLVIGCCAAGKHKFFKLFKCQWSCIVQLSQFHEALIANISLRAHVCEGQRENSFLLSILPVSVPE